MFCLPQLLIRTGSFLNLSRSLCKGYKIPSTIKPSFQVDHKKVLPNKITHLSNTHACAVSPSILQPLTTRYSTSFPMVRAGDVVIKRTFSTDLKKRFENFDKEIKKMIEEEIVLLTEDAKNGNSYSLCKLLLAYESDWLEYGFGFLEMHLTVIERIQSIKNLIPANPSMVIDFLVDIYKLNKLGGDDLVFSESQRLEWLEANAKESLKANREWVREMLKAEGAQASFEESNSALLKPEIEALHRQAAHGSIEALDRLLEVYNSGYIKIGHKRYLLGLDGLSRLQEMEKLMDLNPMYVTTFLAPIYRYDALDFMGVRETPLNLSASILWNSMLHAIIMCKHRNHSPAVSKAYSHAFNSFFTGKKSHTARFMELWHCARSYFTFR